MGYVRTIAHRALCAIVLLSAGAASAAPREPLIVTRLADPDPDYVDSGEPQSSKPRTSQVDAESKVEQAMRTFGRAIGEAAVLQQQQIEALCSGGAPTNAKTEQRFAYEASCRYVRH